MNCRFFSMAGIFLILTFAFQACEQEKKEVPKANQAAPDSNQKSENKDLQEFGIFYESVEGPLNLEKGPTIDATNPSFLIHLENTPILEKLRLRFGSLENSKSIALVDFGEKEGAFEAKISVIKEKGDFYRGTYLGSLKPGKYLAYYFIDESTGKKRWAKYLGQYAGLFTVK